MKAGPWLKWPGGKRWLPERHPELFPAEPPRAYVELCLGGGAVFWTMDAVPREHVVLNDANARLMLAYQGVRDDVEGVMLALDVLAKLPDDLEHFEAVRDHLNNPRETRAGNVVAVAAWVIFHSKRCMNGLWRENSEGRLNVAKGKPSGNGWGPLYQREILLACSAALQGVTLLALDFEAAAQEAFPLLYQRLDVRSPKRPGAGIFLLADPPYENTFTAYRAGGFSGGNQASLFPSTRSDLERLAALVAQLDDIGARWMLTNADEPAVHRLFGRWNVTKVMAPRSINAGPNASSGEGRQPVAELVIRNYG